MAEYLISELEVPEVGKTLIFKDKEARNDLSTAVVETSASNPLTFTTRSAQNAQSAEIVLEPIQDLHGYDHPWPAGGGKNLLRLGESILDNWFATDENGITVDKTVDIKDYVTCSIDKLNGSIQVTNYVSTGYRWLSKVLDLKKNTSYIYSEVKTTGGRPMILGFNSLEDNVQGTKIIDLINNTEFNTGNYEYIVISIYPSNFNSENMMIRLASESDATFAPYSNICPISGHTEVNLLGTNGKESTDPDYVISNDLTKDLGREVHGASYNPVSGDLVVTWGYIAEYNGETLPGEWISDRDVYEPNTSPSTGAEVAYELATPVTYHLAPDEIKLLSGVNTIWTDGTSIKVAYRDGKVATLADLTDTANNLQEQIDQNETMEDETTQLLYKLGVNNGLLFMEEV